LSIGNGEPDKDEVVGTIGDTEEGTPILAAFWGMTEPETRAFVVGTVNSGVEDDVTRGSGKTDGAEVTLTPRELEQSTNGTGFKSSISFTPNS
jgi:hypothetical protein